VDGEHGRGVGQGCAEAIGHMGGGIVKAYRKGSRASKIGDGSVLDRSQRGGFSMPVTGVRQNGDDKEGSR
jgi:hypothetical protein